ncbi:sulfatase-like hydrolase/transferase [Haloferula sp. A504]|uniref:sulfatase-like hydrolase/transferase n=1 Tax=Haloferula sp. A504 TaxID=3373601 RepID=UPI0031C3F280|nr:sulfatase-like hydrolase/transferase [Verrucomicrobiaceae bacterium E54]
MKLPRLILLSAACLCPALSAIDPPPPDKPNIIIIFMDDVGYNDLGIQTYPSTTDYYPDAGPASAQTVGTNMPEPNLARLLTPRIDSLATEGIRFTSFHANPSCSAARGCLMTGRYRTRINIPSDGTRAAFWPTSNTGLNTTEVTLPELLREQGYTTGLVGKWHLGYNPTQTLAFQMMPTRHGFEEFYGLPYSNDMPSLQLIEGETILDNDVSASTEQAQLTWKYTERALDFIGRKAAGNKPFFLMLAHSMTHRPTVPSDREFTNADGTTWPKFQDTSGFGYYYDVIKEVDHSTGRILDLLDSLDIAQNTLVIFTSDNGPWNLNGLGLDLEENAMGSAYPLRDFKQSSLEGGVRVPFLMRWPAQIGAGVVTGQLAGLTDMLPTLVGLAGGTPPQDRTIDGVDLWPILSGQATSLSRNYAIDENVGAIPATILSGDWKLRNGALYNLATDIQETTDLSGNPAYASQLSDLQSQLTAVQNSISSENEPAGTYTSYEVLLSTDTVNFGEGQTGDFTVRLSHDPGTTVTVRTTRFSGDTTLTVAGGATLNFNTSNWSEWQTVTLTDAADGIGSAATMRVTIDGQEPVREVFAISSDDFAETTASYLGTQADMTGWRTSSVDKTYDPDGDDILGTEGYYLFGAAGENTTGVNGANGPLFSLPGYLGVTSGLTQAQFGYASIDNPVDGSPAAIVSGTSSGNITAVDSLIATVTFGSGVPSDLVMTLMNDNITGDPASGFDLRASDGTTVLATVSSLTRNDSPDWHSFDLSGITAGDEVQVWGLTGVGRTTLLGGITFDLAPAVGFDAWATGGETFEGDANGDGVPDGVAFLLGADTPATDATGLLPTLGEAGGDLVMTFSCLAAAARGASLLNLEYDGDLVAPWLSVPVPGAVGDPNPIVEPTASGSVSFVATDGGTNGEGDALIDIVATITDATESATVRLFGRLKGTVASAP